MNFLLLSITLCIMLEYLTTSVLVMRLLTCPKLIKSSMMQRAGNIIISPQVLRLHSYYMGMVDWMKSLNTSADSHDWAA